MQSYGAGVIEKVDLNSFRKTSNTSWNSMFRFLQSLTGRMKFKIYMIKNVSALFIGITNESNKSETG